MISKDLFGISYEARDHFFYIEIGDTLVHDVGSSLEGIVCLELFIESILAYIVECELSCCLAIATTPYTRMMLTEYDLFRESPSEVDLDLREYMILGLVDAMWECESSGIATRDTTLELEWGESE
jgi:hypothetical protein